MSKKVRIPSEIEYRFCKRYKVGDRFFTTDLMKFFKDKNKQSTGAKITLLLRMGIIKPIFHRGNKKDKTYNIWFERVK
jgi:hypothetical protein